MKLCGSASQLENDRIKRSLMKDNVLPELIEVSLHYSSSSSELLTYCCSRSETSLWLSFLAVSERRKLSAISDWKRRLQIFSCQYSPQTISW